MARVAEGLPFAHATCAPIVVLGTDNGVLDSVRPQARSDGEGVLAFIYLQTAPFLPPIKFFDCDVLLHSQELRMQQRLYALIALAHKLSTRSMALIQVIGLCAIKLLHFLLTRSNVWPLVLRYFA